MIITMSLSLMTMTSTRMDQYGLNDIDPLPFTVKSDIIHLHWWYGFKVEIKFKAEPCDMMPIYCKSLSWTRYGRRRQLFRVEIFTSPFRTPIAVKNLCVDVLIHMIIILSEGFVSDWEQTSVSSKVSTGIDGGDIMSQRHSTFTLPAGFSYLSISASRC